MCEGGSENRGVRLKEGGFYRTRNGERSGPVTRDDADPAQPWRIDGMTYSDKGEWLPGRESAHDLVAEWDNPEATAASGPA